MAGGDDEVARVGDELFALLEVAGCHESEARAWDGALFHADTELFLKVNPAEVAEAGARFATRSALIVCRALLRRHDDRPCSVVGRAMQKAAGSEKLRERCCSHCFFARVVHMSRKLDARHGCFGVRIVGP